MVLVQWLSQIMEHKYWETFSCNFSNSNWVNVQWIYPVSISDVISCVKEEHQIMSDKGFFKQLMSEK